MNKIVSSNLKNMEAIIFTHPGLNLSGNVSESIFVALPLSQFCFSHGTLTSNHISTYKNLPWQVSHCHKWYMLRRKMNMSLMWRGGGGKWSCFLCQTVLHLLFIWQLQWLCRGLMAWCGTKDTQVVSKMLGKTSRTSPPHLSKEKISYQCMSMNSLRGTARPLFELISLDF